MTKTPEQMLVDFWYLKPGELYNENRWKVYAPLHRSGEIEPRVSPYTIVFREILTGKLFAYNMYITNEDYELYGDIEFMGEVREVERVCYDYVPVKI